MESLHRDFYNGMYGAGQEPEGWSSLEAATAEKENPWRCGSPPYWATPEECANDESGAFKVVRDRMVFFNITMAPIVWNIAVVIILTIGFINDSYSYFRGCGKMIEA